MKLTKKVELSVVFLALLSASHFGIAKTVSSDDDGVASLDLTYSGQFTSVSCTIGDVPPVNLGVWQTSSTSESGIGSGLNSLTATTAVSIPIQCTGATNLQFQFDVKSVLCSSSNVDSCFAIDSGTDAAEGVAIEPFVRGTNGLVTGCSSASFYKPNYFPKNMGEDLTACDTKFTAADFALKSGSNNFVMSLRYVQTEETIRAGTANAILNINFIFGN